MRFSYRQYREGDAAAINELYFKVTGLRRTIEQHAWQWLQSPAGQSEMWLIEAELDDGSNELIGHHGVMAEEFSFHGNDILVGKTENTMVLPEYREKILYPRFERAFLKQYENRFHALFSTIGPESALRLRRGMGYTFDHEWRQLYFGSEPWLSISLILDRILPRKAEVRFQAVSAAEPSWINDTHIQILKSNDETFDFDHFWTKSAPAYGVTPKRTRANLNWRFWRNPYHSHITVKLTNAIRGTCLSIISCRYGRGLYIDDIFSDHPENIQYFIAQLYAWAKNVSNNSYIKSFSTSENFNLVSGFKAKHTHWINGITKLKGGKNKISKMPRKITLNGTDIGLNAESDWYVTPFYFEGR